MDGLGIHRPRNVDWKRAAALLYGDWGTSKAYVTGLAFFFAGYSSLPIILAVCCLTALVGYNYVVVCKHFPDGGGVYSAARSQSRHLAAIGALLLIANFMITATLGIDILMLGSSQRRSLVKLLKGNVVTEVARNLPESIQLVIQG